MSAVKTGAGDTAAQTIGVEVAAMRAALKSVTGAIERRNTVPILTNVRLDVTDGRIACAGTDLDVWLTTKVDATGDAGFATTVEAATLANVFAKLPQDGVARIGIEDKRLIVSAGRARFTLPVLPVDGFPAAPDRSWDADFTIDAAVLRDALSRVRHAVSSEETRYYLNGVLMHADADGLRFVATDGHRLAAVTIDPPQGAASMPDVIVPRKAAGVLLQMLDRCEGPVAVVTSATAIRFAVGGTVLTAKAVDGTFPDYTRVIPVANEKRLTIDRAALIAAIDRVITISSDKTRVVKVALERDLLTVSVTSLENGAAREDIPCGYQSDPLEFGLNARFALDTLGQLSAGTIIADFAAPGDPTLWRDAEDAAAVFVIMPMRV